MKPLLLFLLTLLTMPVAAQTKNTGVVFGKLTDQKTGEVLNYITVVVLDTQIAALTDSAGNYKLTKVPTGYVRIKFSSAEYKPFISEPILVTTARPYEMNVALEEQALDVDAVKVVGRSNRRIESPPVSAFRINIEQLEKSPGVNRDISKAIQNLPGVVATPIYRNDIIVRGGGPNENKFYLDKIEIPLLNHFQTQGASGGNAGMINTDMLAGATLYTSAFPASKGGALSSVLDMRLKEGNSIKPRFKFSIGASDLAFTLDSPVTKKSNIMLSYRRSYLQFLFQILDLPFLPTYNDIQIKYTYNFDSRNKLYFIGLGSFDENRLNTESKTTDPSRQQILNYLPQNDQWSYVLGLVYQHSTLNGSVINLIASTNKMANNLQKWQDNDPSKGQNLDYRSNEVQAKFRAEYSTDFGYGFSLSAGAQVERASYTNYTYRKLFLDGVPVDDIYNSKIFSTSYGAYLGLDKGFWGDKFHVTLSARIDGNDYNGYTSNPLNQFSPRLALSYAISKKVKINANIGRYFQAPAYTSMGYRSPEGALVNKDRLKYFYSDQAALGVSFTPNESSTLTVEGFFKNYRNYPMSLTDSTAIGSNGTDVFAVGAEPVASAGEGRAYGFEIRYANRNLFGFMLDVSYTYYMSEFRKMDKDFQATGPYQPTAWDNRHLVNIILGYSFRHGWDVGLRWRFAGGPPYTPYDVNLSGSIDSWNQTHRPVVDYSLYNTARLPAFHQLDLRVDKTWFLKKLTIGVYIDIQNLYNYQALGQDIIMAETDDSGQYIQDPANPGHYLMKSYPNTLGGTIIPTFGFIIEF